MANDEINLLELLIPVEAVGYSLLFKFTFAWAQLLCSLALLTIVIHVAWNAV